MGSRVENRRSNCSLPVDIWLGFRRTAVRFGLVLFPVPAYHRTEQTSPRIRLSEKTHDVPCDAVCDS